MTSFLTCTNCLQKSPDSATKCKHCGRAFGRAPERPGDSGSRGTSISIAGIVVLTALVIFAAFRFWPSFGATAAAVPPESTSVAAPRETTAVAAGAPAPATTPKPPAAAPADTTRAVAPASSQPPAATRPQARDTTTPPADTARPEPSQAAAEPISIDPAHQRIAQVYANMRAEPNNTATILRVLTPGEVVSIDSLAQGWYRVVIDSVSVGYVGQQYLDTLPPRR